MDGVGEPEPLELDELIVCQCEAGAHFVRQVLEFGDPRPKRGKPVESRRAEPRAAYA